MALRLGLLLLILPLLIRGQENRVIRGRLLSASTNQPLPFANLTVADGRLSSATNAEGYFMLDLPESHVRDTLTMVALHYRSVQLPVSALPSTEFTVRLNEVPNTVTTADIYFDAAPAFATRDTLLKAVAAISRNYSQQPTLLRGFYRESVRDETSDVQAMEAEGLIEVYKPSYHFPDQSDRIRFLKGRRKPLNQFTTPILTPGPWVSNMLDVVKYQEFLFRNRAVNKNYVFNRTGETIIGDQPVYIIGFRPRDDAQLDGYFTGSLFLTKRSLAIIRAEYTLTPAGLNLLNQARGYVQLYKTRLLQRTYVATYALFGQQWSFQSGSVENTLAYEPSGNRLKARIDFVVTRRNDNQIKPFSRFAEASMRLPMQSYTKTDDTFWEGETYLLPTRP
ncbi:carboxypeptidase-like protein [Spirosoma oryzae]|uniref:Carboxypeptidase-like protein n=1 Tax=Spirosoma oryzae TaxID=1469603 RepID=A0A2T0SY30_9BACT|nr:carboxypeptidase-like regulatory domain-containing protein [Spirosoma oryzae]PRY38324.1 carboxypeptidase-like protein [Spirosoma oryzae]